MKKLLIAILATSGAAVVYAHAETSDGQGRTSEFRAEMRALIAGDGMTVEDLTSMMRERSQARFEALDIDGDGTVTREEFLAGADERAQARFARMDSDEDGVVTRGRGDGWGRHHRGGPRADNARHMNRMSAEERAERIGERFARIDTDGDGMISPEEFEAGFDARAERRQARQESRVQMPAEIRQMHGRLRALMRDGMDLESFTGLVQEQAAARFDVLDADGSGGLTAEEFSTGVADRAERMFARMDRNEDGRVSREDRPGQGGRDR